MDFRISMVGRIPEDIDEPYEYTPLKNSTSIRLIRLLPEDENGMVRIKLTEHDLDANPPSYYCLSYACGNPHADMNFYNLYEKHADDYTEYSLFPISCNGRRMFVRQNLYDALKQLPDIPSMQLRSHYPFQGQSAYFTDLHRAVVEKDIFSVQASIWLGTDIECRDDKGRTALILAILIGSERIVSLLLEAGADRSVCDYEGTSALDYAQLQASEAIVSRFFTSESLPDVEVRERMIAHRGLGPRVWIDAICISQSDIAERSATVMAMDRIYSCAKCTTVWLGREDMFGKLAVHCLSKLWPSAAAAELYESDIVPYENNSNEAYEKARILPISPQEWTALAALYLRQNFRRLWCLQEIVLAKDVIMYLGPYEVPWHEFMMVTEQITLLQRRQSLPPSIKFRAMVSTPIEMESHLVSELRMRKMLDGWDAERRKAFWATKSRFNRGEGKLSQIPLLEMLRSTFTFKCSDSRDHIYAMLGMCKAHPESPKIEVDYNKTVSEVYTEIMRLLLAERSPTMPNLAWVALIRDSGHQAHADLPSWVKDLSQEGVASFEAPCYDASGGTEFDVDHSLGGSWDELVVEGMRIDVVESLASERRTDAITKTTFDPTWFELLSKMPNQYITGQARSEVLWRTLCADQMSTYDYRQSPEQRASGTRCPAPKSYGFQFKDQLCAMILAELEKSGSSQNGTTLRPSIQGSLLETVEVIDTIANQDKIQGALPTQSEIESYIKNPKFRVWFSIPGLPADTQCADRLPIGQEGFQTNFLTLTGGRRLFLTESGYLGLGPMSTLASDEVWLIKGSRVPFLLRKFHERDGLSGIRQDDPVDMLKEMSIGDQPRSYYRYIGDLYVHGLMQGEGLSLCEDWERVTLV